jgi:hypothetical protein
MPCDRCDNEADFVCLEGPEHHQELMAEGYRPDPWAVRVLCRDHTDFDFWPEIEPILKPAPVRDLAFA